MHTHVIHIYCIILFLKILILYDVSTFCNFLTLLKNCGVTFYLLYLIVFLLLDKLFLPKTIDEIYFC